MKHSTRGWMFVALALFALFTAIRPGQALQGSDDGRLDQPVTVPIGETTLALFLEGLSKATGLQIECSESIREKPIVIVVRGQSARSVLDAVSEFNEWTWGRVREGVYRIDRKPIKKPEKMIDVAAAMQSTLPRDLKEYLHLPKLPKEKKTAGASFMGLSAYNSLISNAGSSLRNAIATSTPPGKARAFTQLSRTQQEEVRWVRLFDAIRGLSPLLFDDLNVHHYDFNDVYIYLDNGGKSFTVMFPDPVNRVFGFGIGWIKP